jgi:uncharacterized protein (DUF2267 family)
MQFNEILGVVKERARVASLEEVLRATRSTLSTLNERLSGGEPGNLASQLPPELQQYLDDQGKGERFNVDEFFKRISRREGIDLPVSVHHTRAVISVLREAVSAGEIQDFLAQLPDDYRKLFDSGYQGDLDL